MIFKETGLAGAWLVEVEKLADERGFFARTWSEEEFAAKQLNTRILQCSVSFNEKKGTLRGMHYQADPHGETKLVRCTAGAIYDVIVDLREDSKTYLSWYGVTLSAAERNALYIPKSFAHGFITLADHSEVFYQMGDPYRQDAARGLRWDDPRLAIRWPIEPAVIIARDREWPLLQ